MGEATLRTRLISRLRSLPGLYSLMRGCKRMARRSLVEVARAVGTGPRFGAARGFTSTLPQLRSGECDGRLILEGQVLPLLPERSLIRTAGMNQNGWQPWPVFWTKLSHARLVGPFLAPLDAGKRLMREAVYGGELYREDPSYNYLVLPPSSVLAGRWTSLVIRWSDAFYHWLTEALPRLAPLGEMSPETGILVRGPLSPFQRESLGMLGLLERVKETSSRHLLIEEYYFSSSAGMTGCTNPYAVNWLRERFLPHAAVMETPRRFFIRRRGKTRGITNQEEVADFFTSRGWAAIHPENLTLAEQIAWFHNAEAIVGEHGAAFTNLLWCTPGCKVLELCPDNFLNGCYEGISLCVGINHRFKVFPAAADSSFQVPFRELAEFVEEAAG